MSSAKEQYNYKSVLPEGHIHGEYKGKPLIGDLSHEERERLKSALKHTLKEYSAQRIAEAVWIQGLTLDDKWNSIIIEGILMGHTLSKMGLVNRSLSQNVQSGFSTFKERLQVGYSPDLSEFVGNITDTKGDILAYRRCPASGFSREMLARARDALQMLRRSSK